jgi:CelD/BcsL family acetyltransferase involved in cellulose biosynthesis
VERTFAVTVVPGTELTPALLRTMSVLQASDSRLASPFFSAGFLELIAARDDRVRVGVVRRGDRIVGIFPFQLRAEETGEPLWHPGSDFHGIIAEPGDPWDVQALLHGCGLRSWSFHFLPVHQELFRPYHHLVRTSPYLDLRDGLEAYVRGRREAGTRQILQIEASRRKLQAHCGEVRFIPHTDDPEVFARLREWKEDQYRRLGVPEKSTPRLWSMLGALCRTRSEQFAGMLSALYAGDRLIAAHAGMRSAAVWHYWYPAYDRRFARYQPGLVLLLEIAGHAPAAGITRLDLGHGDEPYKLRLANASETVARGRVEVRPGLA